MPVASCLSLSVALRVYWLRGTASFLVVMSLACGAAMVWPRTYQSEARIHVRLGRETVHLDPTATTGQTVQLADSRERDMALNLILGFAVACGGAMAVAFLSAVRNGLAERQAEKATFLTPPTRAEEGRPLERLFRRMSQESLSNRA